MSRCPSCDCDHTGPTNSLCGSCTIAEARMRSFVPLKPEHRSAYATLERSLQAAHDRNNHLYTTLDREMTAIIEEGFQASYTAELRKAYADWRAATNNAPVPEPGFIEAYQLDDEKKSGT